MESCEQDAHRAQCCGKSSRQGTPLRVQFLLRESDIVRRQRLFPQSRYTGEQRTLGVTQLRCIDDDELDVDRRGQAASDVYITYILFKNSVESQMWARNRRKMDGAARIADGHNERFHFNAVQIQPKESL